MNTYTSDQETDDGSKFNDFTFTDQLLNAADANSGKSYKGKELSENQGINMSAQEFFKKHGSDKSFDNQDIEFNGNKENRKNKRKTRNKTHNKKQVNPTGEVGLRGGQLKGRKNLKKPIVTHAKFDIEIPEFNIIYGYKADLSKFLHMEDLVMDIVQSVNLMSEGVQLGTPDQGRKYVLMDYKETKVIQDITKIKGNNRFKLVTANEYRKRENKMSRKQLEEQENDSEEIESEFSSTKGSIFNKSLFQQNQEDLLQAVSMYKAKVSEESPPPVKSKTTISQYVGHNSSLTSSIKEELEEKGKKIGNLIQGSFGMGQGVDKLRQFCEKDSHLIDKHAPNYSTKNSNKNR